MRRAAQSAAANGDCEMLRYLIKRGLQTDTKWDERYSLLGIDARYGHPEAVELLLKHGGSPAEAFMEAVIGSQLRLAKLLLQTHDIPLFQPFYGKETILVHKGPILGAGGPLGGLALREAIWCQNKDIISLLVEHGVLLSEEKPPLYFPIKEAKLVSGGEWIVNHLISLGAIDRPYREGEWPRARSYKHWGSYRYDHLVEPTKRRWEWLGRY